MLIDRLKGGLKELLRNAREAEIAEKRCEKREEGKSGGVEKKGKGEVSPEAGSRIEILIFRRYL